MCLPAGVRAIHNRLMGGFTFSSSIYQSGRALCTLKSAQPGPITPQFIHFQGGEKVAVAALLVSGGKGFKSLARNSEQMMRLNYPFRGMNI